jgi:hypothetical protein
MKKISVTILAILLINSITFCPPIQKTIKINPYYTFTFTRATEKTAMAIKHIESRGNYFVSGGSGEFGAYQIMPKTWDRLCRKYYNIIKQRYPECDTIIIDINSPDWQDLIVKLKIDELYTKGYQLENIAAIWNSGQPYGWENKIGINKKGQKYNVPEYIQKVKDQYKKINLPTISERYFPGV